MFCQEGPFVYGNQTPMGNNERVFNHYLSARAELDAPGSPFATTISGEKILGLARESDPSLDLPYREVARRSQ